MNRSIPSGGFDLRHGLLTGIPQSFQPLILPHVFIGFLFLVLLRSKTTYLPLLTPALLTASYHEWALNLRDGTSTIKYSAFALFISWFSTFMYRLIQHRRKLHNLPGVPHSYLFGHIPTIAVEKPKFPLDVHHQVFMNHIADTFDLRKYGLFYIDSFPIESEPLLVVICPEVASQCTQIESFPKHVILNHNFGRAIGPRGIVGQEGEEWKMLRTMFNPGFSQANLLSMVPMMVDETEIFASRLSKISAGDGFASSLESLAAALTVDVIGQALLGMKFNSQSSDNALVRGIIEGSKNARASSNFSPGRLDFWRILKLRYYEAISNSRITQLLGTKLSQLAAEPEKSKSSNAIFDIAMSKYVQKGGKLGDGVTKDFIELMRDNVKSFIFAGHDTTSSVLAYVFYELSRNPAILAEVRAEHESVFGPDPKTAAAQLKANPKLATAVTLPLTTAIVRETLRLYLPASTVRTAPKGTTLVGRDGKSYPAEGFMIWVANSASHHDPSLFPSPYDFIPHRFLPSSPFDPIPKNAFRPFEKGSRDCIGQELAMQESRVVLALILRRFDFEAGYEELDRRLGRTPKNFEIMEKLGGRGYQTLCTTAKPKDGLPMLVKERKV